jgi:hypothetical protein
LLLGELLRFLQPLRVGAFVGRSVASRGLLVAGDLPRGLLMFRRLLTARGLLSSRRLPVRRLAARVLAI